MSIDERIIGAAHVVRQAVWNIADSIDRKADTIAHQIRDSLSGSKWLPGRARPPPPPPPSPAVSGSIYSKLTGWAYEHRWAVTFGAAGLTGLTSYLILHRIRKPPKRRANRATNGARKEVVVIAGGSAHDVLTKVIAIDLERRGFIVFVVVNSLDDEQVVLNTGGRDLRPLHIDLLDTEAAQVSVEKFTTYLLSPVAAFPGAAAHNLHFAGMILVAAAVETVHQRHLHPTGPVETIAAADWSDTLNLRVLWPFVTTQLFLRTLRSSPDSRLVVLTSAIIGALSPPFHAPESAAVASIGAFSSSLRKELKPLGVAVCHMKLGTFNLQSMDPLHRSLLNTARADIIGWTPGVRSAYARLYAAQEGAKSVRGSSVKELHAAVFDALTVKTPKKMVRVGSGSLVYEILGRWAPDSFVLWMLGGGRRDLVREEILHNHGGGSSTGSEGSIEWEKVEN